MGWLKEFRSSLENPSTPLSYPAEWLLDAFNGGRTDSGIRVSQLTALNVSTVYACVDLISSQIARPPFNVYERLQPRGKQVAHDHAVHDLLSAEPNPEMTSFTFRKTLMAHALLWSNLFAEIQRDAAGRPVALWPRNPDKTRPRRLTANYPYKGEWLPAGTLVYVTTEGVTPEIQSNSAAGINSGERVIAMSDMLHVPGLSLDGRLGHDIIALSRQLMGLALAAEKFGAKYFGNGARPGMVVTVPQNMSPAAAENFRRSIQEYVGGENIFRPFVVEDPMKAEPYDTKNNDAQFIETKQDVRLEIASLYHVPPHMVGLVDKSSGRSNMEQMGQEFLSMCLSPWFTALSQEGTRKLFPPKGRTANRYFAGFDLHELMLPDAASRGDFYAKGKQWGFLNTNDIHDWEGLNPVNGPEGDDYWKPVNMMNADESLSSTMSPKTPADGGDGKTDGKSGESKSTDPESKRYVQAYFRLFNDRFSAYLGRDKRDAEGCRKLFLPALVAIADGIRMNAAPLLGAPADADTSETDGFLAEYAAGMFKRSVDWQADEAIVRGELSRAVRAIRIAVYRDLATQKAKGEA